MSGYRTQQHRLVHRGQTFHFVSYEGQPADEKSHQPETPPSWYLMRAGKRWMVGPQAPETVPAELDRRFGAWLDACVFRSGEPSPLSDPRNTPEDAAGELNPAD